MSGKVYLIGAGPGDPDLITRKGFKALEQSDVVMIDRLAPDALIDELSTDIEIINCGKRAGQHKKSQSEINRMMLTFVKHDNRVVSRLKGGDPFIFGRGGEELRYLHEHDVPVEVIPGITAANAVAASIQKPLTDREIASEVTLLTGHEAPDKSADRLDWECMANCRKTLAIYMGVKQMDKICKKLIRYGRSPKTPAVVVEEATTDEETVIQGTLSTISKRSDQANIEPPALILIGEVIGSIFEKKLPEESTEHEDQFRACPSNSELTNSHVPAEASERTKAFQHFFEHANTFFL